MCHVETGMFPQISPAPHVLSDLGLVGCRVACTNVLRAVDEDLSGSPTVGKVHYHSAVPDMI